MIMKKIYILFTFILFTTTQIFSQGIINNGAKIYIAEGAFIHGGNFTNNTAGQDGEIDLNGTLELEGSWYNNSEGEIFVNIEATPNGTLILNSIVSAEITGTNPTSFENLIIKDSLKTLYVNECNIYGVLTIDGILNLNKNKILIQNNSDNAITYSSGSIISESLPAEGLSEIEWLIGTETGTYNVPFGSGIANNDLNIQLIIATASTENNGSIIFATYPTDEFNMPFPEEIISLNDLTAEKIADRFYKIQSTYTSNNDISLAISYSNNDITEINNPEIVESNLKIIRYNTDENSWSDAEIESTVNNNTVVAVNISKSNLYNWWSIASLDEIIVDIPNGITPNGDGYNDTWILGDLINCKVYIYNRWGSKVYSTENYDNSWDGGNNPSGAYFYMIELQNGTKYSGDLNILRE